MADPLNFFWRMGWFVCLLSEELALSRVTPVGSGDQSRFIKLQHIDGDKTMPPVACILLFGRIHFTYAHVRVCLVALPQGPPLTLFGSCPALARLSSARSPLPPPRAHLHPLLAPPKCHKCWPTSLYHVGIYPVVCIACFASSVLYLMYAHRTDKP